MSHKILKGTALEKDLEKKSGSVVPSFIPQGSVVRKSELQAKDKAKEIIEEALGEAQKIKEEANQILAQIEREREKARQEGYEEGKREGLEEFTQEILKAKALEEKIYAAAEPEIIQLVFAMVEKVVGTLVEQHKEVVRSIVLQALERSLGDRIVIRLHPEDFRRLRDEEKVFKEHIDKTKHLYLKEDDTIQKGGCIVETEIGTIDAQLDTQLKAIRKAFGI